MSPDLNERQSSDSANITPRSSGSAINGNASQVAINNSEPLHDYDKLIASRNHLVASGSVFADYDSFTDVVVSSLKMIRYTIGMNIYHPRLTIFRMQNQHPLC